MANLAISDILLDNNSFPVGGPEIMLKDALELMNQYNLGIICIVDDQECLKGVFTDGDLRRILLRVQKPLASLFVDDVLDFCALTPKTIMISSTLVEAVALMEEFQVWDLPVLDEGNKLMGLLHLHPVVKSIIN